MAYRNHPSTFDPSLDIIRSTSIGDPEAVDEACIRVRVGLRDRVREETVGAGHLAVRYAPHRIRGSITDAEHARALAVEARAPERFIGLIDEVLAEARAALAIARPPRPHAAQRNLVVVPPPPVADWARGAVVTPGVDYDALLRDE